MSAIASARSANRWEILAGRTLAACVHPAAAWHSTVRSFRVLLIAGYFAAGYIGALAMIMLLLKD
jgi:hypothetical protein